MEAAFAKARQELGEDALLLESRRPQGADRTQGAFEVVVGIEDPAPSPTPSIVPLQHKGAVTPDSDPQWKSLIAEVAGLRQQLSKMSNALNASAMPPSAESQGLQARLEDRGVPADTAATWLRAAEETRGRRSVSEALTAFLGEAINTSPAPKRVIAVVGPAGAGKTTALVKLAFQLGLNQGKRVTFLSLDDARIGAAEQLRVCASVLGAKFVQADYSGDSLQAITKVAEGELLLIDTPGLAAGEDTVRRNLADALSQIDELEIHLVLTATTRTADLRSAMQRWQVFRPEHLLITHMDDAENHGHVLALAAETGTPISHLSWGRQIPEDLEPASREKLIQLLLAEEKRTSVAAA